MTREEAAKTLTELWGVDYRYCLGTIGVEAVDMAVEALKEPERKKGKWIWVDEIDSCSYTCSECSYHAYGNTGEVLCGEYKYCPHCGTEMEEEDDKQ